MDILVQRRDKALQTVQEAQADLNAANAKKNTAQRAADDANAVMADCVVVP